MTTETRDRAWMVAVTVLGGLLLIGGLGYVRLLAPVVDPDFVIGITVSLVVASTVGLRIYLAAYRPLDPARASTAPLTALIDELIAATGVRRPRFAMDDSRLARAVANVGAVEMGPRSETILFTEQLVTDLEAGRFALGSLRGVVLHELGHLHHDHSYLKLWTGLGERLVRIGALAALFSILFSPAARQTVTDRPSLALAILAGPFIVTSVIAVVSRANEEQADDFAIRHEAGRDLLEFLRWMGSDLAPFFALEQGGLPRDPAERARIRDGIARLVADAEAVKDEERAEFFRAALVRVEERLLEDRVDTPRSTRVRLTARRIGRTIGLAWLGIVPWNRSHPPLAERIERIAARVAAADTAPAR